MYQLRCFAPDGESVTEGEFATVAEAWERAENMGSRWFFYPFSVVTEGEKVVSTISPLGPKQGCDIWELSDFIKDNSEFLLEIA